MAHTKTELLQQIKYPTNPLNFKLDKMKLLNRLTKLDLFILTMAFLFTISSFGLFIEDQRFCFIICAFIGLMMIGKVIQLNQNKK